MKKFPYTVLAIVLIIVLLAIMFTAGAVKAGLDANTTPVVMAIVAMVAGIVPGLLALIKSEQNGHNINETHEKVQGVKDDIENGVLQKKVEAAIRNVEKRKDQDAVRSEKG